MASLPKDVASVLRTGKAAQLNEIFDKLDWPAAKQRIPLPETLTAEQRAAVEVLASRDDLVWGRAMPKHAWSKRRWLGIDPPGGLEQRITVNKKSMPLWFALAHLVPDGHNDSVFYAAEKLPLSTRVLALVEVCCEAYNFTFHGDESHMYLNFDINELTKKDAAWLSAAADWLLDLHGKKVIFQVARAVIFAGLIRSKAAWQARYSRLAHWALGQPESAEYFLGIPEEHREAAVLFAANELSNSRWIDILEKVDSPKLVKRLIPELPELLVSYPPWVRIFVPKLKVLAKTYPEVGSVLEKHAPTPSKKKGKRA
jgi:hypothetical protein